MPQTLPRPIHTKLAAARTRLRAVDLALGLARAVIAVSLVLVLLFTLDITLQPPLPVVRSFALFVGMLALAGAAGFLTKPLRRRLDDDMMALIIEDEYPDLHGGLVSSVQLVRELERSDLYTSRALIQATIDRTAEQVAHEDFSRVVRTGPLIPLWLLIGAFLVLGGAMFSNSTVQEYGDIFYRRVVLNEEVPYPTLVGFEVSQPRIIQVAKGDDLDIDVKVTKGAGLLDRLVIHTRFAEASAARNEERDLLRKGDLLFHKAYQNVTEPFSFYVSAPEHGVHTPRYQVKVIQRPRVEQYEFVLGYPDYVRKPNETVSQPDLQVPSGTEISFVVVSNKPLKTAKLIFEEEGRPPTREERRRGKRRTYETREATGEAIPTKLADIGDAMLAEGGAWADLGPSVRRLKLDRATHGKRVLVGRFPVLKDLRFRYHFNSEEGLETGRKPVVFTVRVVRDRRPVVRIPVPGRRKQVTPQAKVPLEVDVRDDYGISHVELRVRTIKGEGGEPSKWRRIDLVEGMQDGARRARLKYTIDMADQRLQPGDRLRYFAKAYDQNVDKTKNFNSSRVYEIQVVRPQDLERILQDRLTALKERLKAAARDQAEARKGSEPFVAGLQPKVGSPLTDDDRSALRRLEYDQRRVTNRLSGVKKELEEIRDERLANRLTEQAAMALIKELHKGVKELSDRQSPLVSRELEDARKAAKLDTKTRTRLSRVPDLQEEILLAIKRLVASIDKFGDFTEVIQELQDLLKGEDDIIKGTKRAIKEGHGD